MTKVVNQRSFLVQSDRGAVVRRNRHQLKLRGRRSDGNSWEIEQDEDVQEQVEQDKKVQEQVEQDEPESGRSIGPSSKRGYHHREEGRFSCQPGERTMTLEDRGDIVLGCVIDH